MLCSLRYRRCPEADHIRRDVDAHVAQQKVVEEQKKVRAHGGEAETTNRDGKQPLEGKGIARQPAWAVLQNTRPIHAANALYSLQVIAEIIHCKENNLPVPEHLLPKTKEKVGGSAVSSCMYGAFQRHMGVAEHTDAAGMIACQSSTIHGALILENRPEIRLRSLDCAWTA